MNDLIEYGNKCLEERDNIPSAPLWHMGKVAKFESKESFDLLQNTVDYLVCKAKLRMPFTDNEKEFMKELFEALWWGGKYHGFYEAATLANHYVNGNGNPVSLNATLYKNSIIVKDTANAMRKYMLQLKSSGKNFTFIKSSDPGFLHSEFPKKLKRGKRNSIKYGHILHDGALLAEQVNLRLKNADNRFHLTVRTTKAGNSYCSVWQVKSVYDFEPFAKNDITDIPLSGKYTIKLPDGLSRYLAEIKVAKVFNYGAIWSERWK
ncbi:hypothetical protein [Aliikangiella maris]|uniref:Uncharacterized protein n=2 Tax=Aliikangiella maris TaxID=3162458 RepID=A0ABV2BXI4_9GAMM